MALVLVVEDSANFRRVLKDTLEKTGLDVITRPDVDSALPVVERERPDLVITDLKMPGKSGMDLLRQIRRDRPELPVIMVTGFGAVETAVDAMRHGAYDFITKPFDEDELNSAVVKALNESRKNRELISAYFDKESPELPDIIGGSQAVRTVLQTVQKIAPTDSTVLITGETGVGKELVARAVHLASRRREHPFVKVNCAAIPEGLLESELFGHEKGAFTGAVTSKPGRFELAHEGTIFLDEIGEIPMHLQAKLLGAIQDRAFERVGGVKTIRVDVRIVAATNVDLDAAVRSGKFRSDLFYRLNVVPVHIPPLRERKDDIAPLTDYLLKKFATKYDKKTARVSNTVRDAFLHYGWPGNIRELENITERAVVMSDGDVVELSELPDELRGTAAGPGRAGAATFRERVDDASRATERQMIIDALDKTGGNRTKAAELLGISRRTLQNKIKQYGL